MPWPAGHTHANIDPHSFRVSDESPIDERALPEDSQHNGESTMKKAVAVLLLLVASATAAGALDLSAFAPCRPAAAKLCDRTGGMTWSNLLRCGATLAANRWRVGSNCREVLRRYGQL